MFKKKLVNKCLAFGLSFTIMFGGMSGMTVRGNGAADTEATSMPENDMDGAFSDGSGIPGVLEDAEDAADECPSGVLEGDVQESGEILVISEKTEESEGIALSRKEQKAAEKAAKKAEKESEKEAKEEEKEDKKNQKEQEKEEKKEQKEQEKEEKEQQKEERKLAKKFDKEKHEKTSVVTSVDGQEELWNIVSVGSAESRSSAVGADSGAAVADPVKVAILDSGVDYTDDIDVYMRKNFVPGEDDISVIYEDISGHGTSVAGIIAAKDNDEGITGINPNVQLYSARILDENKQAPASRVVAAIDWAIAQDVDIINISFGTTVDSEEIHAAIKRAYDANILIVAAAGNNGVVEYPAAYDEVIAVGAVDAKGERAEGSAIGDELELVAPGQQIVSTGVFGGICVVGGTSLAAPHVAGVASVLWQKDKSVSADFIRSLLAFTANQYGEDYEYGNGLVDLDFSLSQYDAFKEVYVADADVLNEQVGDAIEDGTLEVNEKPVVEFADVVYVEGNWWLDEDGNKAHAGFAEADSAIGKLSGTDLAIVKKGALGPDINFSGMYLNSEWHGQEDHSRSGIKYHSNYVYTYMFITEIAKNVKEDASGNIIIGDFTSGISINCAGSGCASGDACVSEMKNNILNKFTKTGMIVEDGNGNKTGEKTWYVLLGNREANAYNVSLYIYGLALHTVTDAFAHSAYVNGKRINHNTVTVEGKNYETAADNVEYIPGRFKAASFISKYVIYHTIRRDTGTLLDFYLLSTSQQYDKSFKLGRLVSYIKAIDVSFYRGREEALDAMSQ